MKYYLNKNKQISKFILIILVYFFSNAQYSLSSTEKASSNENKNNFFDLQNKIDWENLNINKDDEYKIRWEILKKNKKDNFEIKWNYFDENKDQINLEQEDFYLDSQKNNESLLNNNYSELFFNLLPIQISPTTPINNFYQGGDLSQTFTLKSAFSGGNAGGTGNQNYSYRVDYAFDNNTFVSGYISEADDPYYRKIKNSNNLGQKNFWRNYSFSISRKINQKKYKKIKFSLNAALELWDLDTLYKKGNSIGYYSGNKFIGSVASPITYDLNKRVNLTAVPRIAFLPQKIGNSGNANNFYGNSFSLGLGADLKIRKSLYFLTSYNIQLGPGFNSFDDNLVFSRNNIYNLGFQWEPSPRINLRASITNAFGETPSTGDLTIPSANEPLYTINLKLNSYYPDTKSRILTKREKSLLHKGHSVNNALLPKYGSNQIWFDYDNKGSLFGFYGYSFSDAFQIEIANLGRFKNNVLNTNTKYKTLTDVFAGKQNLNNRFGGKLLFLSPTKGDPFWLSSRITLGRDQESDQGYSFIELNSTKELNPTLALNINPKYVWSGHGNIGGIGLGINYKLNNKFQLIPEINFNIPDNAHNNNSIILRYLKNEKRAFDLYLSNAFGSQDIGQLIKSKDYKYGFKINLIF